MPTLYLCTADRATSGQYDTMLVSATSAEQALGMVGDFLAACPAERSINQRWSAREVTASSAPAILARTMR
jgi:hypothetical protein